MPDIPAPAVGRRSLHRLTGIFIGLLALAACRTQAPLPLTPEEQGWIASNKGLLTVLLQDNRPPFTFRNEEKKVDGLFVDYLHDMEKHLGLKLPILSFDRWDKLLAHAEKNRHVIILTVSRTKSRSDSLLVTAPVVKVPYAVVTRKTSQATGIPEFAGKTLCTTEPLALRTALDRFHPHVIPTGVETATRGLYAVSSGTCDAMVINSMEASYLIEDLGLTNLHIADRTRFLNRLALATSGDNPMLFGILEKAVDSISLRRHQELYRRWVSPGGAWLPDTLLISIEVIVGIVISVIFLLWAWTSSLRQQVGRQTKKLRDSRENLRITLDSMGDGVITADTTGVVTRLNPAAEALTGWSLSEAEGRPMAEVFPLRTIHTDRPQSLPDFTDPALRGHLNITTEATLVSRNEAPCRICYNMAPIRDEKGHVTGAVIIFNDITDKSKAEEEVLRMKKLESLGILAGGIAHDFNNLLTGLYGNLSMAKMALPEDHEAFACLASAEESMEAAIALTGQFLTFAKHEAPVRKIIPVGKALADAATFATHGLNTRLETAIDEDLWPVAADKGQLNQIMGNLIINAHQAMATGGVITLTAKNAREPSGRFIRITVKDTGTGIPPEHLDKIFDPYFTTKTTGSGLGLATTHAIVTKHGGTIKVDSEQGVGTVFTVDFPAADALPAEPPEDRPKPRTDECAKGAHVLILDDQAVIRKILETILLKMGIEPTFTVEGEETVRTYRQRLEAGTPFDAVILDLTIPGGMGGREASEKILAMDPGARIIISSGYASDPIMSRYEEFGIKAIAVKPYRFSDFQEILLGVLQNGE
ncbi:ATP-binding protein [Desulfoluna spongiiphila]|uniref:histidine kinase n=1 Tax=Desulfoluna spongiiphila TaxID=419481 RepID=A0A1G5IJM6_9BACT|nr:ATP-binding protein [Desulfoluna spongiiphila]SCY76154.1 PAS domain S-box-containing protein [Desulfoluna spongiiphila]